MMKNKKTNSSIDCAKLVLSLFVVTLHTAIVSLIKDENIRYFCSLTIATAVPFFFVTSSFLFFNKVKSIERKGECTKSAVWKYFKRIWILYTIWFILFLPNFLLPGEHSAVEQIKELILRYTLVVGRGHLWYLWASLIGVPFIAFMHCKHMKPEVILTIGILLFCFSRFFSHYASSPESSWNYIFTSGIIYVYGICASIAYSSIGYYISTKGIINNNKLLVGTFVIGYVLGWMDHQYLVTIGLLPISFSMFQLISKIEISISDTLSKRIRCMSTFIYCVHLYIIHNIYSVEHPVQTYLLSIIMCLLVAYIFALLKERIYWLKYLV